MNIAISDQERLEDDPQAEGENTEERLRSPTVSPPLEVRQATNSFKLARFLLWILVATLIAGFSLILTLVILSIFIDAQELEAFTRTSILVKDVLILVLMTQMLLIGTVLGFYFGSFRCREQHY